MQAGAAKHVDRDRGNFHRDSGIDCCLTGRVLSQTCLNDVAHVDLIDLIRADTGAIERLLDDNRAKSRCRGILQGTVELADCGSACACKNYFTFCHCEPPCEPSGLLFF